MITKEEWEIIEPFLCEGVSFEFTSGGTKTKAIMKNEEFANLNGFGLNESWPIKTALQLHNKYWSQVSNFCFPDGTPILEGCKETNLVIRKIKSLDMRVKNKTLPKTKMKPLPLGA